MITNRFLTFPFESGTFRVCYFRNVFIISIDFFFIFNTLPYFNTYAAFRFE